MSVVPAWLAAAVLRRQFARIERDQRSPMATQERAFARIHRALRGTVIARATGLEGAPDLRAFAARSQSMEYGQLEEYVARTVDGGERGLLFHGAPAFVGLSSGTTGMNNKRIVHSASTLRGFTENETCIAAIIARHTSCNPVISDRLLWGASPPAHTRSAGGVDVGYISGKLATNIRWFLRPHSLPSAAVGRIADPKEKFREAARELRGRDVQMASAVPTYLLHLLEELRTEWGIEDFSGVWPNLRAVIYSGTPIDPYRAPIERLLGHAVPFFGMYVSTEAPLGCEIPSLNGGRSGLYSLHLGRTAYTFRRLDREGPLLTVADLVPGDEVELFLTAENGLVNYRVGDCLRIHSTAPLLVEVTGRVGHGLNLATEKVTLSQLARAFARVAEQSPTRLRHYFVCPGESERGRACYAWTILTDDPTGADRAALSASLDRALTDENGDYGEMRADLGFLDAPTVSVLPASVAHRYFARDSHRGQFKMKTAFPTAAALEEFLRALG